MAVKSMLATLLCVCAAFSHAQADDMPWGQRFFGGGGFFGLRFGEKMQT